MKTLLAVVLLSLAVASAAFKGQDPKATPTQPDPNKWEFSDKGRRKILISKPDSIPDLGSSRIIFGWSSPSIFNEPLGIDEMLNKGLARYVITGVENNCLQVEAESKFKKDSNGSFERESLRQLSIPSVDGAFHLYTPHSINFGAFHYKITLNHPQPGLLDVQLVWDAVK